MKILLLAVLFSASICLSNEILEQARELAFEINREERAIREEHTKYVMRPDETVRTSPKLQEFERRREAVNAQKEKLGRIKQRNGFSDEDVDALIIAKQKAEDDKLKAAEAARPKNESPEMKKAQALIRDWNKMQKEMPGDPTTAEMGRRALKALEEAFQADAKKKENR